jgi:antitoxin (DNA-binding transcriptional repressor) of toxin-antitoxin stability system
VPTHHRPSQLEQTLGGATGRALGEPRGQRQDDPQQTLTKIENVEDRVFYRGESMDLTRGGTVVARLVPAGVIEAPTGREVLAGWKNLPHLSEEEAEAFAAEIESGRQSLNRIPTTKWD